MDNDNELYKKMYLYLFNQVSLAINYLRQNYPASACKALLNAQTYCEELYAGAMEEKQNR